MDMNSPGVDSRTKDGAKVAKFSSRMDSLLATLKQDIKALRCQGDQVSETMWNLYQTFEDVLYERSTFLFSNEKISEESMEDGDSGVATATEDGGEECNNTKYLSQREPSHGNFLNDDTGENDKYVPPRAWYELDDEDDDENEYTPQNKNTRNGLTEEWIKYGHFQLTGKHYEMTGEKDIPDRDSDTIQYDWGSFSDDDEVATLPYDWEAEELTWSNNDKSEPQTKSHRQMYRIEDQKVVPNSAGHYHVPSNKKIGSEHSNNYNKTTTNNWETNTTPLWSRGAHHSCENNTGKITCKDSYNGMSNRSSNSLSHLTSTQSSCNQNNVDIVCTCKHNSAVPNMRPFERPGGKHIDKNNNENASRTTNKRIITNGTLSDIRKKKQDDGIVGNVRATDKEFDDDNKRTLMRAFSERIPRVSSTVSLPNSSNTSTQGAHIHPDITQHYNYRRHSITNVAGNRQPLILSDMDTNFTENVIPKTDGMPVKFNDLRYHRNTRVESSPGDGDLDLRVGDNQTELGIGSNWANRRTTWDLGAQDFDLDRELAKEQHDHSYFEEKRPRLRTYHGPVLPSKIYFPTKEQCSIPSSNANKAEKANGMLHAHDKTRRKSNDKETLRLCAIRYAGFKAAWQSPNNVGKRRSFSGFTVLDKSNHVNRRRESSREQLQSTYC